MTDLSKEGLEGHEREKGRDTRRCCRTVTLSETFFSPRGTKRAPLHTSPLAHLGMLFLALATRSGEQRKRIPPGLGTPRERGFLVNHPRRYSEAC